MTIIAPAQCHAAQLSPDGAPLPVPAVRGHKSIHDALAPPLPTMVLNPKCVTHLNLIFDKCTTAIKMHSSHGTVFDEGGEYGTSATFTVGEGDYIDFAEKSETESMVVDWVKFHTHNGTMSRMYGTPGGNLKSYGAKGGSMCLVGAKDTHDTPWIFCGSREVMKWVNFEFAPAYVESLQ